MATEGPQRAQQAPTITSLPRVEDLPIVERGYEEQRVREAFEGFRRHVVQLQAQLRVLQAAGTSGQVEPTGHAVRMDALHLIREAAEFADVLERDAQRASAAQIGRTEEDVRRKQAELRERENELERFRAESERLRTEVVNAAKAEARQLVTDANRQASQEVREAEARGTRLLEQARHQATELTNATRAEVEQTLEWARAQASVVIMRAQQGAEQLLAAAGLGEETLRQVVESIVASAQQAAESARPALLQPVPEPEPKATGPRAVPEPEAGAEAEEPEPEQAEPEAASEPKPAGRSRKRPAKDGDDEPDSAS